MNDSIQDRYSIVLSRDNIERALRSSGKDRPPRTRRPWPAGGLPHHGRYATGQLVELARITGNSEVLDAGSGVGGTARYVADRFDCRVTVVDLTDEYCETNRWLNGLVGLNDWIGVRQADVTELPFVDGTFDVVISRHVQMNVVDKARLYSDAPRMLKEGGRRALWDIMIGGSGEPAIPYTGPTTRAQAPGNPRRAAVESARFAVETWSDLTDHAAALMQAMPARPQPAGPARLRQRIPAESGKSHPRLGRRVPAGTSARR